eukprot:5901834-Amphidinium_carterae.1
MGPKVVHNRFQTLWGSRTERTQTDDDSCFCHGRATAVKTSIAHKADRKSIKVSRKATKDRAKSSLDQKRGQQDKDKGERASAT